MRPRAKQRGWACVHRALWKTCSVIRVLEKLSVVVSALAAGMEPCGQSGFTDPVRNSVACAQQCNSSACTSTLTHQHPRKALICIIVRYNQSADG